MYPDKLFIQKKNANEKKNCADCHFLIKINHQAKFFHIEFTFFFLT